MATPPAYSEVKEWFDAYYEAFMQKNSLSEDDVDAISIKYKHSYRVVGLMETIGTDLGLSAGDLEIARIIGLLHDVARFSQYAAYHTMQDLKSVDHGDLGAKIVREESPVRGSAPEIVEAVCLAVQYHNKISLPNALSPRQLKFCQMARDADKIDVFAIACPVYHDFPDQLGEKLKMQLPSSGTPSDAVLASFARKSPIKSKDLANMTDFKLFQLAWLFDLNFAISVAIVEREGYLDSIFSTLPKFPKRFMVKRVIDEYLATFKEKADQMWTH